VIFLAVLSRDLGLAVRHGADTLAAVLFFLLAGALFPLALGPSPELLRRMAPGVVWVCALLAALLPLDRMFGAEAEDGSLDQLMLSGLPASGVALAKALAHWLTTGLPLMLASLPLAVTYGLAARAVPSMLLSLALGTASLSLLGTMAAAIVLGARRGGVLLPLLVLPLASPILIFGAAATDAGAAALGSRPELLLLGALLALALPLCPLAGGAALRVAVE
jgi:heme exporter protein B